MTLLAYVFPGQGSQEVGMLRGAEDEVVDLFTTASESLGYDLWDLVANGPENQLNRTEFTQPALLTSSIALYQLALRRGARIPDMVAGHSLGEYTALVAAEVISFTDAVVLVQKRGQLMQTAVPLGEGGMAAILGLEDDQVREICAEAAQDSIVQAANFNAPGQVVIAGENKALARAIEACKAAGARRALPLSVSAPFHSSLMKPAADQMALELDKINFSAPRMTVVQNVDALSHSDPKEIKTNLVTQMYSAVLWTNCIQTIASAGVTTVVECGPGKVLSGLTKRIDKGMVCHQIGSIESMQLTLEALS